jgi:O-antigen/teichoic acid export membrane protein
VTGLAPVEEASPPAAAPAAARPRLRGLASRDSVSRITVMAIRMLAMALNFAVQLVMARVMGLAAFGTANTAIALLNILVIPAALGYETAAIRYVALARDEQPLLRTLTIQFARTVAIGSLVTCLFVATAAAVELALGRQEAAIGLAMLIAIIPGFALVRVGEAWLRGFGSLVRALINSGVITPVLTIAFIAAIWLAGGMHRTLGVEAALGARAAATAIAVLSVGIFIAGKLERGLSPRRSLEAGRAAEIHRTAIVLCGVAALTMAISQMDIVAVNLIKGAAEAGVYSAASRVVQAMNIALVAVNFVLAPKIARLFAGGERARLQREVSSAAGWSFLLMGAACLVLVPGASFVLGIFGPGFGGGADALRVLMLGQLVNALCGPAQAILNMTGLQGKAVLVLAVSAAIDIVLFALLIPPLGLVGAAAATASCTALWNFGMLAYVRRRVEVWSLPGVLARALP